MFNDTIKSNVHHILIEATEIHTYRSVLIIGDKNTKDICDLFFFSIRELNDNCIVKFIEVEFQTQHGLEPSKECATQMLVSDLTISLATYSFAHSKARLESEKKGRQFLSLPFYDKQLLMSNAIKASYRKRLSITQKVSDILTGKSKLRITSTTGTDLSASIENRISNCCPGFVSSNYLLGSPPDIEANISPIEEKTEGVLVVDGSITTSELGLLTSNVVININKGYIVSIECENETIEKKARRIFFTGNKKKRIVAEIGIGLNNLAELTGNMLTDEGALGTIHVGFGSNHTVGGKNKVDFHLDCIVCNPTLTVDDKTIIFNGELSID